MIRFNCAACGKPLRVVDELVGRKIVCRHCDETQKVPYPENSLKLIEEPPSPILPPLPPTTDSVTEVPAVPVSVEAEVPDAGDPKLYPRMRRELIFIRLRQWARKICDSVHLGPSTGERFCCALIVATIAFALSFGMSIALKHSAPYAALRGFGAFVVVALFCSVLIIRGDDKTLEARRAQLVEELPAAMIAWREARVKLADEAAEAQRAARGALVKSKPRERAPAGNSLFREVIYPLVKTLLIMGGFLFIVFLCCMPAGSRKADSDVPNVRKADSDVPNVRKWAPNVVTVTSPYRSEDLPKFTVLKRDEKDGDHLWLDVLVSEETPKLAVLCLAEEFRKQYVGKYTRGVVIGIWDSERGFREFRDLPEDEAYLHFLVQVEMLGAKDQGDIYWAGKGRKH